MSETHIVNEVEIPLPARRSNRPVTFMHRVEYGLARILFAFFHLVGIDRASAIAGGFTRILGPRLRSISRRAEDNLAKAFPDWRQDQITETTKDVWENLGRTAAEFAHLKKFRPFEENSRVSMTGEDRLRAVIANDKPAIFISGHFANWEVIGLTLHRAGLQHSFVYRAANNPLVDELIIQSRGDVMSRHQIPKDKRGARALVETIHAGRSLAMFVDQKLNDGISAPFMGRPAMTAPSAARLALKFSLPVIPVSIERRQGAHFHITIHDPIAFTPASEMKADVLALTTKINQALERDIRARPGQWLWLHRRWPKDSSES